LRILTPRVGPLEVSESYPQRNLVDASTDSGMVRVEQFSNGLMLVLEYLVALLLAGIWIVVSTLVALRYLFNSSIVGANELVTILFVYTSALGAALAIGRWEHIGITVLLDRLPPRTRWILDLLRTFLVAVINGVIVVYSLGWLQTTGQFVMPSTGLPRWVAQACVPMGCSLAVFFCLVRLMLVAVRGPQSVLEGETAGPECLGD
jgi:TRAP-type C4-dicarboxylate transport system permease small subunit